jgi:hypothetical protein
MFAHAHLQSLKDAMYATGNRSSARNVDVSNHQKEFAKSSDLGPAWADVVGKALLRP